MANVNYCSIPITIPMGSGKNKRKKKYYVVLESEEEARLLKKNYRLRSNVNQHKQQVDLSDYLTSTSAISDGASPLLPLSCVNELVNKYPGLRVTEKQLIRLNDKKTLISIVNKKGTVIKELTDLVEVFDATKLDTLFDLLDVEKNATIDEQTVVFKYKPAKNRHTKNGYVDD